MLWLAAQLDELNPQHVLGFGGDAVALVQPHAADPDDILLIATVGSIIFLIVIWRVVLRETTESLPS